MRKNWTDEEVEFVMSNASEMPIEEIAVALGRTVNCVRIRVYQENAHRENKVKTHREKKFVKEKKKKKNPDAWAGCDEDCFNCKYTDCKMPAKFAPIGMQYSEEGIKEMIKKEVTQ